MEFKTSNEEFFASLLAITNGGEIPPKSTESEEYSARPMTNDGIFVNVNLDQRVIEPLDNIGITKDHNAETIYFVCARFYDSVDLADTCCVIQYVNALGEGRIYVVPWYDIASDEKRQQMIIPWYVGGEATKAPGIIKYSIRFFQCNDAKKITYNLNTLPSQTRILEGINVLGYYPVTVTSSSYKAGKYYIRNAEGNYEKCTDSAFDPSKTYYSFTEKYIQETDTLDAIYSRLDGLEKGNALYWFEP